jgi:hypothetical protein
MQRADSKGERGSSFSHVEINVSDPAWSIRFWSFLLDQLGYVPHQEWPEGRSWWKDRSYLVLVQVQEWFLPGSYHRSGVGSEPPRLPRGIPAGVARLAEVLRERGVPMLYADRYPHAGGPGPLRLVLRGPSRIKVRVVATEKDGLDG